MKGKISINKVTICGSSEPDYISITVEDESSGVQFLEVSMGLKDFADAIMGLGHVPITFEIGGLENIGKKHEVKTEIVDIHHPYQDEKIRKAVAVYEVDGWIGNDEDAKNHHNYVACKGSNISQYKIHYHRWVDIPDNTE